MARRSASCGRRSRRASRLKSSPTKRGRCFRAHGSPPGSFCSDGIPTTLIADTMAGHFMSRGEIDCVVVGADRIAANGDMANKIGTYQVAVLARSTAFPSTSRRPGARWTWPPPMAARFPIEERRGRRGHAFGGRRIAPAGIDGAQPGL